MDNALVGILLLFLLVAVTLNLILTLRIAAIVRETPEPQDLPFTLELDAAIPHFVGTALADGRTISADAFTGRSTVLAFLSSGCGDCRKRVPELVQLLPAMRRAGVVLWVVVMDTEAKARSFLGATPLIEHAVMLDPASRKRLNPRNASPFYIFVDDQRVARASHFIGDENWQVFVGQMQELLVETQEETVHG